MRRYRGALALALFVSTSGCQEPAPPHGSPVMFRGDAQHSGVFETVGVEEMPGLLWRFDTGGPVFASPVVSGGTVFTGSTDGKLYALDARTGEARWTADVQSPVNSTAAVAEGLVVFASRDGVVHAVDAGTGEARWDFATGPLLPWDWGFEGWDVYVSSPTVRDSVVVVGAGDGSVYALGLHDGTELWRFETGGRIRSSPAIAGEAVYAGSADGRVYALSLADGSVLWRTDTEGVGFDSGAFGFDRKTIIASPAVVDGVVYVGARDGYMYALDAATGARLWRVDHSVSWAMSSPSIRGGALFSGTSDQQFVHRVDVATGEEVWRFDARGYTWSSPALVGSTVYIGDGDGNLWALDAESGVERWRYRTAGGVVSSPWVEDGVVYFGDYDGAIYALGGGTPGAYRAVFWDEALTDFAYAPHMEPRSYFAQRQYEVLSSEALAGFMEARVEDGAPSVIVFAMDNLPASVAAEPADTVLLRRYLEAGGKAVWLGLPPLLFVRNDEGRITAVDKGRPQALLGVDYTEANFDFYGAVPTELGRTWGLSRGWLSTQTVVAQQDIDVLAVDENGRAAAWVKDFGGPRGSGFVGMSLELVTPQTLAEVLTVAEYGLGGGMP